VAGPGGESLLYQLYEEAHNVGSSTLSTARKKKKNRKTMQK
jgi:hypothetical protein